MKDISLVGKKIIWDKCKILYDKKIDENWQEDWTVMAGEWSQKDGALIGKEYGNKGGILFSKECFDKDVMISFTGSTILPATRDVNAVFCAKWDEDKDDLGDSYVCGLNGWYDNKAGLERNKKGGGLTFRSLTNSFKYVPGTQVRLTCGAINGHLFMVVDGQLVSEYLDMDKPLTSGHVGISPYCTMLKIKDIEIREIYYEKQNQFYIPEFK